MACAGWLRRIRPTHQADAESATLWKLYVAAHQQGRGLGRRLIDAIRAELIPTTLWLRTEYLSANARAAGFYTAQGSATRLNGSARLL